MSKLENPFSQEERRRVLANDRQTSTLGDHVEPSAGGRFAELARREGASKPTVIGADPAANYPAGPAWTNAAVGLEPPLGVAIDAMEPVGEAFEIEASLAASVAPASVASSPADLVETDAVNPHSHEHLAEILPHIARRKL
jgi:hypothetical protein